MYTYRPAEIRELERIWDQNILENPGDENWPRWKKQFIEDNQSGRAQSFLVFLDDMPVGEGTLLFSPQCTQIRGRTQLCDGKTVCNINALRIQKAHEGQGHISKLVKEMENYAKEKGFRAVTIGVEANEARNLAIYLHFGYQKLVHYEIEGGELVLYYEKTL